MFSLLVSREACLTTGEARAHIPLAMQRQSQNSPQYSFLSLCALFQAGLFLKVRQSPLCFLVYPSQSWDRTDALYMLAEMRVRKVEVFFKQVLVGLFNWVLPISSPFYNLRNLEAA